MLVFIPCSTHQQHDAGNVCLNPSKIILALEQAKCRLGHSIYCVNLVYEKICLMLLLFEYIH